MKIDLINYQRVAAEALISSVTEAFDHYRKAGVVSSIPLIATTGAGKTVIAATVLETLIAGSEELDALPRERPVILWFSHDPQLNEQTRHRLESYSDVLNGRVKTIDGFFSGSRLAPGHVYMLNAQKLSAGNRLVRESGESTSHTIYEILANTVSDPDVDLLMVIDEAHQGQRDAAEGKHSRTIVSRLIDGHGPAPAMPVVLGKSATAQRFKDAMSNVSKRLPHAAVEVPIEQVQASGLLKDMIVLDARDEDGRYDRTFVQLGAERLNEVTRAWGRHERANPGETVVPLMVVQLPSTPNTSDVCEYIDTIIATCPDVSAVHIAHARQSHTTWDLGRYRVPYIAPSEVQDAGDIRVLLVQEAVTTGWDCPRAEVLVSLKTAAESTYITQMVGRLLRTPLAKRVDGDDILNAAFATLPRFDSETLSSIVRRLEHGSGDDESEVVVPGREVIVEPVTLELNPTIERANEIVEAMEKLPSYRLPKARRKPVPRLYSLLAELAADFDDIEPHKVVKKALCARIDAEIDVHRDEYEAAVDDILNVEVVTTYIDRATGAVTSETQRRPADDNALTSAYNAASLILPGVVSDYTDYLIDQPATDDRVDDERDDDDDLWAEVRATAIAAIPDIVAAVNDEARKQAELLFKKYRTRMAGKSTYTDILLTSDRAESIPLEVPSTVIVRGGDNIPKVNRHVLSTSDGQAPMKLNTWETKVIAAETSDDFTLAWYRNPSSNTSGSLGVRWVDATGEEKVMRPDFLIVTPGDEGVNISIVDPHSIHLDDAVGKLRGLCDYAEEHGEHFLRIDSVAEVDGALRVISLKERRVRDAVRAEGAVLASVYADPKLSHPYADL